jgi:hypothetical protein
VDSLQNVSDDSSDTEIIESKDKLEELYQLELEQTDIDSLPIMKALKEAMIYTKEYEQNGKPHLIARYMTLSNWSMYVHVYVCVHTCVFTCKYLCIFI